MPSRDLTDVTLTDLFRTIKFATNAIGTMLWSNLDPMQVVPSGGQFCNQFKLFHLNQSQTIPVERFTQVMDSILWAGSVVPLAMFITQQNTHNSAIYLGCLI